MKRTPLKRKTPMKRGLFVPKKLGFSPTRREEKTKPKPRKPLNKVGKKTKEWIAVRRELKATFKRAGITTCELRLPGCWTDNALGFAHTLKRRNIRTPEEFREVALACNVCHDVIESGSPEEMAATVRLVIASRLSPIG